MAIANLLFGRVNFSAKLPMSFPRSEGQIPVYYNSYRTGRPWESSYGTWYQDMPRAPLFPFGYGLSYTTFDISKPEISSETLRSGESISVSVNVVNTGDREGETVIQLYICDDFASLVRPVKELKAYEKISLKPKESKRVSFTVNEEMLKFWTENRRFEAEEGSFSVWVSDSSNVEGDTKFNFVK